MHDDDDDADEGHEAILDVTINRSSKRKAGFVVEKRPDGFYYISKVPDGYTKINVGDRVMEINGTTHLDFKTAKRANDLIDSFRLEVIPIDDDNDAEDEEEPDEDDGDTYEEVDRSRDRSRGSGRAKGSKAAVAAAASSPTDDDDSANEAGNDDDGDEDDYDEDYDDDEEIDEETRLAREAARANAQKRNASDGRGDSEEDWDRPYYAKYKPNERFMITATKDDPSDDPGVTLVEYQSKRKTEIYVADIRRGPFFKTHLYKGDKILSVNGKKHPKELKTAEQAQDLLESKLKATVFAIRPDPEKDDGYKWVMENC